MERLTEKIFEAYDTDNSMPKQHVIKFSYSHKYNIYIFLYKRKLLEMRALDGFKMSPYLIFQSLNDADTSYRGPKKSLPPKKKKQRLQRS